VGGLRAAKEEPPTFLKLHFVLKFLPLAPPSGGMRRFCWRELTCEGRVFVSEHQGGLRPPSNVGRSLMNTWCCNRKINLSSGFGATIGMGSVS